ncbi:Uncharacterised protein [BD1-7 clade bacterium]|uniref:IraD/Gp25-like domain-containing protein n=1 Tax=BD1-7 clade bacterium TaxID=2029982 RepID=A0A5S9NU37_9GAMM|nr:Uncharacterised protein [BD1-7 clade bacterium]CAA0109472.1 Uncharacterised protein [BD1-7 clade bacterium]
MAELTNQENLQPSLLDRLLDDEPETKTESREKRVLNIRRLKEVVVRDLADLLNALHLEATEDIENYDYVKQSVVNYGVPGLTGFSIHNLDAYVVEKKLREAICHFEPRILRDSLIVRIIKEEDKMSNRSLTFQIEGQVWSMPVPIALLLRTEVDLETGAVQVK